MAPTPVVIGSRARRPAAGGLARPALSLSLQSLSLLGLLAAAGCTGDLAHRSVAEFAGSLPLAETVRRVRFEVDNGTVGFDVHDDRSVSYAGGVRRAANSPEELAGLDAVPLILVAEPDPDDPTTLIVRAPAAPSGSMSMIAVELGIRLPADLELAIDVVKNGHITVANRQAALEAATGRGDLRFEHCYGSLRARTGRGNTIVYEHRGRVDVHAAVGDMQIFVREPAELIRLDTGEGTLQCLIPPTTGFRLDARAEVGRIVNSFGFEASSPVKYSAAMTGERGDGSTEVVLRTGKGTLSLLSKKFD